MADNMSKVLSEVADFYLAMDAEEIEWTYKSYYIDYSDEDVMNATPVFLSILWNRFNKSWNSSKAKAEIMWQTIHKFVKYHTGIDTKKFYK